MKALARYGKAFGGYRMIDVPKPVCGPEDIIIEIKAAAICGADMKHYKVRMDLMSLIPFAVMNLLEKSWKLEKK